MTSLRESVVEQIYLALETGPYVRNDFDVSVISGASGVLVEIQFIPHPTYKFSIEENAVRNLINPLGSITTKVDPKQLLTKESPGDYKTLQVFSHEGIDKCIDRIHSWCKNIEAELSSAISNEQMQIDENEKRFFEQFDQWATQHISDKELRFSDEEAKELRQKLEAMAQQLDVLQESSKLTEAEVSRLKEEIDRLSESLPRYPKGIWFRMAANRMYKLSKNVARSKEAKELALSATKKFLGIE